MQHTQQQQQLHQQLNHQYKHQHQLRPNPNPPQPQQHTQQERSQQQSQPLLKKETTDQDSYKEPLTSKKRNGDSIPKGINTRLNTNFIRSKAITKFFSGAASNDFIHYINPTLQNPENQFETAILQMGVNDLLKWDSNFDVVTNNIMNITNEF